MKEHLIEKRTYLPRTRRTHLCCVRSASTARLEELTFCPLLVDLHLGVHMPRHDAGHGSWLNPLQPFVPVVFFRDIVVYAVPRCECAHGYTIFRRGPIARRADVATVQHPTCLSAALKQVRQRAASRGRDEEHATQRWARLVREQGEY